MITKKAVTLFSEFCSGYSGIKIINKTDVGKSIIKEHDGRFFPFLNDSRNYKIRTEYYTALSRLLFAEESTTIEDDFGIFIEPFDRKLNDLLAINSMDIFKNLEVKVRIRLVM